MAEKKKKMGRPRSIPTGAVVWSVRVTERERKAIEKLLERMRKGGKRSGVS